MPVDPEVLCNSISRLALSGPFGDPSPNFNRKPWPADPDAIRFRPSHASPRAITDFLRFNFCQG
jgi:hypothetical protein